MPFLRSCFLSQLATMHNQMAKKKTTHLMLMKTWLDYYKVCVCASFVATVWCNL